MNLKRDVLIIAILILIQTLIVTSRTTYPEIGMNDQTFFTGAGIWNSELTSWTNYSRSVDGYRTPLVEDLDGDGDNEIIVFDSGVWRIYEGADLDIVDSLNMVDEELSNILIFDIDGDSKNEIIYVEAVSNDIVILEYNGTTFFQQTELFIGVNADGDQAMIQCRGVEDCLAVVTHESGSSDQMPVLFFNTTTTLNGSVIDSASSGSLRFCFPDIKSISVDDYDHQLSDGIEEYIFSYTERIVASGQQLRIAILEDYQTVDQIIPIATTWVADSPSSCEDTDEGQSFTPPLSWSLDGSSSNGNELAIAYKEDNSDIMVIAVYNSDGSLADTFGTGLFESEAVDSVGNLMVGDVFPSTGDIDFCAMGYNDFGTESVLLCGTATGAVPDTQQYFLTTPYTLINTIDVNVRISHLSNYVTTNERDEVILPFGVYELNLNPPAVPEDLDLLWANPVTTSALIPIDLEKLGKDDLLALTLSTLTYFEDGRQNSLPNITLETFNPCLDEGNLGVNTSMDIFYKITDPDGANVRGRSIVYYGDSNEQDSGFSAYDVSGDEFSFLNFSINTTIANGKIRLIATDETDPVSNTTKQYTFTVANDGKRYDDCIQVEEVEEVIVIEPAITPIPTVVGENNTDQTILQTKLVDITNPEQGLLPNTYQGLLTFFTWMIKPLVIFAIAILILLLAGLALTSAKKFAGR